jgi:hypothetical protein
MAICYWTGGGINKRQVVTLTVASVGTVSATINGNTVSYTTGSTTAECASGLAAAIMAADAAEFSDVTATVSSNVVTLTAKTPGTPFTVTSSGVIQSTVQDNVSRNDWDNTANWHGGTAPNNGDTVIIDNSSESILWNINKSSLTLVAITIRKGFTGFIGLTKQNPAGYPEYRTQYLTLASCPTVNIETNSGDPEGRIRLSIGGSSATTCTLAGQSGDSPAAGCIDLVLPTSGTHVIKASNVGVTVGRDGQTATTVGTLMAVDSNIQTGTATSVTNATLESTVADFRSSPSTSLIATEGSSVLVRSGAAATVRMIASTLDWQGGNISTGLILQNGASAIFSESLGSGTVADIDMMPGTSVTHKNRNITITSIGLNGCKPSEVTLNLLTHSRLTPANY